LVVSAVCLCPCDRPGSNAHSDGCSDRYPSADKYSDSNANAVRYADADSRASGPDTDSRFTARADGAYESPHCG
jgi:hypothetical protein